MTDVKLGPLKPLRLCQEPAEGVAHVHTLGDEIRVQGNWHAMDVYPVNDFIRLLLVDGWSVGHAPLALSP